MSDHRDWGGCRIIWMVVLGVLAGAAEAQVAPSPAAQRYLDFTTAARQQVLTPASCPFSPASVALLVGNDPVKLADWVRSRIAYEPYAGVVRGPEGTLAARAGGDWDRALLLQALLAEAGYPSHLKVIPRTPEEAGAVVDQFLKAPPTIATWFAGAAAPVAAPGDPIPLLKQFGIAPENRALYSARETARLARLLGEALDGSAAQTPRLLAALSSTAKPGQSFDAWRGKLLAGAAERVELEITTPKGPTVLSVAPENSPADPARLASAKSLDAPPPEKLAHFSIRLELSTAEEGKPAGEPVKLIDREMPLGDLFHRPIRIEIVPSDDAAAAKPMATWSKADWYRFVNGFKNFQAMVRIGAEWEASKVFDTDGQIHDVSSDGRIEGATQMGGALNKGFGGFGLGGGAEQKPAAKTHIDSLVLTLELALPGEKPQIQQRLIYGKDRPGVTPVFTADALVEAGQLSPHAVTWLVLDAVTRNAPLAARVITTNDPRRFEQTQGSVRLPMMLYDWQTLRLVAAAHLAGKDLTFLSGPAIVMHTTSLSTSAADQSVATRHAMDVAFDQSMLLPRSAGQSDAAAVANAGLGVAATVLESGLLRKIDPALGARGAYNAFEEAATAGANPIACKDGAAAAGQVKANPLVAWSLARNESGRAMVFPGNDSPRAWWSVDSSTGATIGRGDGGEGQSAMEYLQVTKKNLENLKCMLGFMQMMLGGKSDRETSQAWIQCETGTDNAGNGFGGPGNLENLMDPEEKVMGIGIGAMADCLGGAKDLYDSMNSN